jgi:hypothetical protein
VVPVRALARDGDTEFLVRRAPSPPTTADRRFRDASAPLARAVQRLVADARTATHDGPAAPALIHTLGADLRAAVADLRELAEGYDVAPAVRFFAGREPGAGALDARTLAALAVATAGLLGETDSAPAAEEGSVPVDAADGAAARARYAAGGRARGAARCRPAARAAGRCTGPRRARP